MENFNKRQVLVPYPFIMYWLTIQYNTIKIQYTNKQKNAIKIHLLFPCKAFTMSHYNECVTIKSQLRAYRKKNIYK